MVCRARPTRAWIAHERPGPRLTTREEAAHGVWKNHVENPFEYVIEEAHVWAFSDIGRAIRLDPARTAASQPIPVVRRIEARDLWEALKKGAADVGATRDDILFIGIIYPLAGLLLARLAFSYDLLPLVFPLASGFALIGPFAAVGLYELSRRRELGEHVTWADTFGVLRSPALGSILGLGALFLLLFSLWLAVAYEIYLATLKPAPPCSRWPVSSVACSPRAVAG